MTAEPSPSRAAAPDPGLPALAYLTSQYPMLSMIFVIREIVELRRLGFRIETVSVNRPDRAADAMTALEAAEAARTYGVKAHGVVGALAAHAYTLVHAPGGYLRGWALAGRLARFDLRRFAFNLAFFTEALMVGRWMARQGLRHVHVHLASQPATVGLFVKHVFGVGLSITLHGPDELYDVPGQYLAEKVAAADFICCISHYARSQLMRISPYAHWARLEVCRLGVDPQVFRPVPPRPDDPVFRVVCVGRLTPAKGQHVLVDAVSRLAAGGCRIHLRIVGDGVDRAALERHVARLGAAGHVSLEGPVNQDRLRDFYAAADCFCIASFAEGIPVVLMEAMAMELACVTTHITGIPELIRNGVDGLLVAPGDVDGLVDALQSLIDDPGLRRRLGVSARQRVLAQYDLAGNVAALAEIFRRRLSPSPWRPPPRASM